MIDLYYWTTPNGHKITIFLEEAGLAYKIVPVNISQGDQFKPEFLAISPNNRIPAIVDHEPKGRRQADRGIRIGRYPALSGREDWKIHALRLSPQGRGHPVAVLANGRARSDGRSKPSFQPVCANKDPLCDRPICEGDESPLWRPQ